MHTISVFEICTGKLPGTKNENVKKRSVIRNRNFQPHS